MPSKWRTQENGDIPIGHVIWTGSTGTGSSNEAFRDLMTGLGEAALNGEAARIRLSHPPDISSPSLESLSAELPENDFPWCLISVISVKDA